MYSLLTALKQTQTKSVRGLQAALSSKRSSAVQLIQTHLIHRHYVTSGGRKSGLGFSVGEVQFDNKGNASRRYRGGEVYTTREGSTGGFKTRQVSVNFLGFHCHTMQGGLGNDEPYFVIGIDTGVGSPVTQTFKYENVEVGTEMGGGFIVKGATPDPMNIRVFGYENDEGDPDETAKNIQAELVKLSQGAAAAAGAVEGAADGPAASTFAGVGGALGGAWGSLIAVAIVGIFGMGDDFIAQGMTPLFMPAPDEPKTPADIKNTFQGHKANASIMLDGGGEGKYELFFRVDVEEVAKTPVPPAP